MYEYRFTLERVVDGDTIDGLIDLGFGLTISRRVRLLGVNTPETRTRDLDEKAAGLKAKAFVVGLLSQGNIRIKTQKDATGKYGRLLADVWVGEVHVQSELLRLGLAKPYNGGART